MTLSTLTGYADDDYAGLVNALGVPYREREALRRLLQAGAPAVDAVCEGLLHELPAVRVACCRIVDHHLEPQAIPALLQNMRHPEPQVRSWALHALACDRCKEGSCRPGEGESVPIAIELLQTDPNPAVRTMAAELIGPSAIRNQAVVLALQEAAAGDPHPNVRKKASWYVPGGPIHRRLAKKATRRRPPQSVATSGQADAIVMQR